VSLAQVSVRRPVLMTVLAIGVMLLGFFGYSNLGVREYPSVDSPVITVFTSYPGANAAVVEAEVTEVLEEAINSASGIKTLTSTSQDGRSRIRVEFAVGFDMETAANDVRDRVSRVQRRLPDAADVPNITKSDADAQPILTLSLLSDKRDAMEISEIARNQVKERLQTITGVSEVVIWGEKRPVVRLWLDPIKMQSMQITASDISAALAKENLELPAGRIEGESVDLSIRTLGRFQKPSDFLDIAVKKTTAGVIRLEDVASIHYEPQDPRTGWKRNGKNVITIALIPQPGSNHVEIADDYYKRLEDIRRELPEDVQIIRGMDATKNIRASIKEVLVTLVIAFILVVLVIFAFLRETRTTFIPMIVIPISIVGSFFVLYMFGFSINVLTLLAMVLAIGLVVDDAIVIVENIYHKIENKMSPKQAAVAGTNEIFFAVIATSVVLMAVFVPMLTLGGTTGLLFREFVAIMIGSVFISTVIAFTLSPMLCSKFLRKQKKGRLFNATEPFFVFLNNIYSRLLKSFLKVRFLMFPILFLLFALAFVFFKVLPQEMAPLEDRGFFMARLALPEGLGIAKTRSLTEAIVDDITTTLHPDDYEEITAGANGNTATIRVILNENADQRRSQSDIAREVQGMARNYPDVRMMVIEPQSLSTQRGGMPVDFVLQAPSIEVLRELVPAFLEEAQKDPTFSVVNSDLKFTKPELHIEILRNKARESGVYVADIASAVELALGDRKYGDFYMNGRQYDVVGAVGLQYRGSPDLVRTLSVKNSSGEMLSLDNFVELKEKAAAPALPRYNRFSSATISAGLVKGKTVGDGVQAMRNIAAKVLQEYPNVSTELAGTSKEYEESSSGLLLTFLLAIAFVFLVLAGQFESFRSPFVTLFTVPLALVGALLSLYLFDITLNVFSEIALILLIGLVTKNGILIVEFANQIAENTGCDRTEAARLAAERRFRPILMTSFSTVLGSVPLIMTGTPSRVSMGIAIVGGLSFATILTLFVVPAAYSYFAGKIEKKTFDASKMAGFILPLLFASLFLGFSTPVHASELLTPETALQIALSKNHSILIAEDQVKQAQNSSSLGSNALLPTLDFTASRLYSYGDQKSWTQASVYNEYIGDLSVQDRLSLALNYRIFDGFASWNAYQLSQAKTTHQTLLLNTEKNRVIKSVLIAYYSLFLAQESYRIAKENLEVSASRLNLVKLRYESGVSTRLDYLSAQMDYATDSAQVQNVFIELQKKWLLLETELGGVSLSKNYHLIDSIHLDKSPIWLTESGAESVYQSSLQKNLDLQAALAEQKQAQLKRSQANSNLYPKIDLTGSWNYTASEANVSNPAESKSNNLQIGAYLKWNLFNGLADQSGSENAKIQERSAGYKVENIKLKLKAQVFDAINAHIQALQNESLAKSNLELSEEIIQLAKEQFEQGVSTAFEFRENQNRWNQSFKALIQAQIEVKLAEIDVLLLMGAFH
jgi:hydrophobe/amphiphile efflux-1 (HAE1) family protein